MRTRGKSAGSARSGALDAHQGYQPVADLLDVAVDEHHVELRRRPPARPGRSASRRSTTSAVSVPRPPSRRTSSSQDGGARKTSSASGMRRPDLPGALQLDLQQHRDRRRPAAPRPGRAACRSGCRRTRPTRAARRSATSSSNCCVGDEVVVDAVDLARPRLARGRRHRQPDLGVASRAAARRPCSCRPRTGRTGRSAADAAARRAGGLRPRRRTRAPARRPGWRRGRAPGGSRRSRAAP